MVSRDTWPAWAGVSFVLSPAPGTTCCLFGFARCYFLLCAPSNKSARAIMPLCLLEAFSQIIATATNTFYYLFGLLCCLLENLGACVNCEMLLPSHFPPTWEKTHKISSPDIYGRCRRTVSTSISALNTASKLLLLYRHIASIERGFPSIPWHGIPRVLSVDAERYLRRIIYYYWACHPTICSTSFNIDQSKHSRKKKSPVTKETLAQDNIDIFIVPIRFWSNGIVSNSIPTLIGIVAIDLSYNGILQSIIISCLPSDSVQHELQRWSIKTFLK